MGRRRGIAFQLVRRIRAQLHGSPDNTVMALVLIPLPRRDFDPTEVAVSWSVLTQLGHKVLFATPGAGPASGDEIMLSGRGLDPWGFIPGLSRLTLVGRVLRADGSARADYMRMLASNEFQNAIAWSAIDVGGVDALLLPGGHRARGMREYLESTVLQEAVAAAFAHAMPVAAICHGVLLAARSRDAASGRSVLYGRRTTALTWALERRAWRVARVSRFWDGNYYRTYLEVPCDPAGHMSVQAEVTRALASSSDFIDVDPASPSYALQSSGRSRDTLQDARPALVVTDQCYISARWPGDAHTFALTLANMLAI
jgi:putative intracellular protease/amidase